MSNKSAARTRQSVQPTALQVGQIMNTLAATLLLLHPAQCLRFRRGSFGDLVPIATTMAKNLMNPLSIKVDCFEVAESEGQRIGWGQLRPLGPAAADPDDFDAAPGSRGADDVDAAWDALPDPPTGFASLPWTDEYKAFARGADERRRGRDAASADGTASALAPSRRHRHKATTPRRRPGGREGCVVGGEGRKR